MKDDNGRLTPLKAIRAKCKDCCGESAAEVKRCHIKTCSLWPYRLGKRPDARKREYTDEERIAMKARAEHMRHAKKILMGKEKP